MRKLTGLVALYSLLLAASAAPALGDDGGSGAEAEAVRAVGRSWQAYYEAGNFAAIPELYTEDAMIMPRGRPRVHGREGLRRSVGGLAAGRKVAIRITEKELTVVGDVAWFIGDFEVTYASADPASPPHREYGRSLIIYRKGADGRWRIHRDIDSPAPPP